MSSLSEFMVVVKYSSEGLDKLKSELDSLDTKTEGLGGALGKSLSAVTSTLLKFAAVTAAAGLAVYKISSATVKYTDKLYSAYMMQLRLGASSLTSLKAMGQAAEDVGSSVDDMVGSLAGLQHFQRYYGAQGTAFIQSFIPNVKQGDNTDTIMHKLAESIPGLKAKGVDLSLLLRYTEKAGINENLVAQMWDHNADYLKNEKSYIEASGKNEDKAKEQALSTEQSLKKFGDMVDDVEARIMKPLMGEVKSITDALMTQRDTVDKIFDTLNEAEDKFSRAVDKFSEAVDESTKSDEERANDRISRAEHTPEPSFTDYISEDLRSLLHKGYEKKYAMRSQIENDLEKELHLTPNEITSVMHGGITPESHGEINAVNPTSGAFGLFQLLGDRLKRFNEQIGKEGLNMSYLLQHPDESYRQQLMFFDYERTHTHKKQWSNIAEAAKRSAKEGTKAFSMQWEVPSTDDDQNRRIGEARAATVHENNTKVNVFIDGKQVTPHKIETSFNNMAPRYQQQRMA